MIQYAARFWKHQFNGNNETLFTAMAGLLDNMGTARKLFRLFKSFNEYVKIKAINKEDIPALDKALAILARLGFLFYWFFDNLAVLIKVKFLQGWDLKAMGRRASKCWLIGIILSIVCALMAMYKTAARETMLLIEKSRSSQKENFDSEKWAADMAKCKAQRRTNLLNIIKNAGDGMTASQALGYPTRFLGINFNDGVVGVGGFTSAFITCYQTYPAPKPAAKK
jgi:hypothetical protein